MLRRLLVVAMLGCFAGPSLAHFQELLPSADVLPEGGAVTLELTFTHPMSRGPTMEMARPDRFGMKHGGRVTDLTASLVERRVDGRTAWGAAAELTEPGAAVFFVAPKPYWEPAEGKFIVHYAKVVVDSYASGEGWDAMIGLPVEIEPLVRPTGLWTGNIFSGIVTRGGRPAPFAEIEIEYVNDGSVAAPNDAFVTQVIKADGNGVFSYAMPRAGWWGFAAVLEADEPMPGPDGEAVPVELGALIWVRTVDMAPGPAQ